ncbi:hypothetical protein NMY22_g19774 [Coprinellus aureogranulatus]|nr:hypothetical protein NMY22_g19774 [Coprinellus aureogranulatus]
MCELDSANPPAPPKGAQSCFTLECDTISYSRMNTSVDVQDAAGPGQESSGPGASGNTVQVDRTAEKVKVDVHLPPVILGQFEDARVVA